MANAVARALRQRGIDVLTASEAALRGVPDREVLAQSHAAGRVVATQDADYLRLHRRGREHAGIAYCAQGTRSIGQIVEGLVLICEAMTPETISNCLEFL